MRAYRPSGPGLIGLLAALVLTVGGAAAPAADSAPPADHAVLERFAPQSPTTWWAIVQSDLTPRSWLVRTIDGGGRWQDVTPPVEFVSASAFVGTTSAWVESDQLAPGRTTSVYRTLDGGRSWLRLGSLPSECQLDFVDDRHGWCIAIGAAAGSETVRLFRTVDGGSTWTVISRTGLYGKGSTSGALPYECDKTISFTTVRIGWAATFCNGGVPYLYTTRDGGARWHALAPIPLPTALRTPPAGEGLSLPAVSGSRLALSVSIGGTVHGATAMATSENGGRTWQTRLVPGPLRYWTADLVNTRDWLFSDGVRLVSTGDAGRHWHSWQAPVTMKDTVGAPLVLRFLSARLGFALPNGNDGPLWRTRDGGTTWVPVRITAGPLTLPR